MKLNRSIEAWDKCDAGAMSKMSEAAIKYAFADAKQDIKQMAAIQAQLVEALGKIYKNECEVFDEESNGMVICCMDTDDMMEVARTALAAAGEQP